MTAVQKPNHRDIYKGVSPDHATLAGDFDLVVELADKKPPDCATFSDLPVETQVAARSGENFGLAGAACLDIEPAYGRTGIFRLTKDCPASNRVAS